MKTEEVLENMGSIFQLDGHHLFVLKKAYEGSNSNFHFTIWNDLERFADERNVCTSTMHHKYLYLMKKGLFYRVKKKVVYRLNPHLFGFNKEFFGQILRYQIIFKYDDVEDSRWKVEAHSYREDTLYSGWMSLYDDLTAENFEDEYDAPLWKNKPFYR